jgi:putative salt-induced outer membrane protein
MKSLVSLALLLLLVVASNAGFAQEENGLTTELELGALFTSGNTEDQTLNFASTLGWQRNQWEYVFSLDGLFSSKENEVTGQRFYAVVSANYEFTENSFFLTRFAHEDDRFSGFDSQSDITFSYGRNLLTGNANMGLDLNIGIGARRSRLDESDFDEPILRLAGEYDWNISETASFDQTLSAVAGSKTNIFRSETSIQTQILENLSLRFSINIKHQTNVPAGREKTDTETAITFVMNF